MNLFENDLVLFPMHVDLSHWVLAVADFRSRTITSYDRWCLFTPIRSMTLSCTCSMGSTHQASLEAIRAYLDSEHKATKGSNLKGFWMCQAGDCPQQVYLPPWSTMNHSQNLKSRRTLQTVEFSCAGLPKVLQGGMVVVLSHRLTCPIWGEAQVKMNRD